jgi:hypothetical protein
MSEGWAQIGIHVRRREQEIERLRAEVETLRAAQVRVTHILENIADPYNERIGPLKVWANEAIAILAAAGGGDAA